MSVDLKRLGRVFGDRVLVKRLERPEKRGGLFVPASFRDERRKETDLWFGEVVALGLDSKYPDAYKLTVGDVIGMDSLGGHSASFEGEDGSTYVWVPEEFIACRDRGHVAAYYADTRFEGANGLEPLGSYCVVVPQKIEKKKNGIIRPDGDGKGVIDGTVESVSIGALVGGELVDVRITAGSCVLLGEYSGAWARLGYSEFLLVKEMDVIAELSSVSVTDVREVARV